MPNKKILILEKYREQEPEILKQNNLISCSFEELYFWSETNHDLLNELIAIFQQTNCSRNLFEYELIQDLNTYYDECKTIEQYLSIT